MQTNQQFRLYKAGEIVCWFETKQHNCPSSLESFNLKEKKRQLYFQFWFHFQKKGVEGMECPFFQISFTNASLFLLAILCSYCLLTCPKLWPERIWTVPPYNVQSWTLLDKIQGKDVIPLSTGPGQFRGLRLLVSSFLYTLGVDEISWRSLDESERL